MSNILVINASGPETRVALVENGSISEFYLERKKDKGIVGNIYKGKVVRVLPGMQAAFVDIGLEKAAFLYVGDVAGGPDFSEEFDIAETPEGEHADVADPKEFVQALPAPESEESSESLSSGVESEESAEAREASSSDELEAVDDGVSESEAISDGAQALEQSEDVAQPLDSEESESEASEDDESVEEDSSEEQDIEGDVEAPAKRPRRGHKGEKSRADAPVLEPLARRKRREGPVDKAAQELARAGKGAQIQDLLKEGQEVIVQVVKDPIGTKGARVTCHISLPGRHLVFMPTVDHVGISRRIEQDRERKRLRELVDGLRPPGTGFIVRTVADGVSKEKFVADIKFLLGIWNDMAHKKDRLRAPALLHPDLDLILRSIRDLFSAEVEKLVIDDRDEYERITQFVSQSVPNLKSAIELYEGKEPIFDAYGIEQELARALGRKVWLKSGGYLIIDQAEALVAIDINSGKFVGKKNLEETITQINIEAAKEIVYQLRLRNIGGIIIIDFIDMEKQPNREKVFKALQDALQKDRAKTNIVKISELGLVEMTRKRVRESVGRLLHEPCSVCDGRGYIKSKTTVAYEIFRELQREAVSHREDTLIVTCSVDVARYLTHDERDALRHLMMRFNKTVTIKGQPDYRQDQFDIALRWSKRDEARAGRALPAAKKPPAPPKSEEPQAPMTTAPEADAEGTEEASAEGSTSATSRRRRRRRRRNGKGESGGPSGEATADTASSADEG